MITSGTEWRVGRKVGRTIYLDDELVGLMDTPKLAALVVEALNSTSGRTRVRRIRNGFVQYEGVDSIWWCLGCEREYTLGHERGCPVGIWEMRDDVEGRS